jgi:hypothetical protein
MPSALTASPALLLVAFACALAGCAATTPLAAVAPAALPPSASSPWLGVTLPAATNVLPMNDAPVVVVDGAHVLLDGEVVGDVAPIVSSGYVQSIDRLHERLRSNRTAWLASHEGREFPGEVNLVVDARTSALIVKSVFQTAHFAGYWKESFVVRSPSASPDGSALGRLRVDGPRGGRLEQEAIQGVVRAKFRRFRRCYEEGLRHDAELHGRVSTWFVIGMDGRVIDAHPWAIEEERRGDRSPGRSEPPLDDAAVVACIVQGFKRLTFPRPEGGPVTVVYPIVFDPGD